MEMELDNKTKANTLLKYNLPIHITTKKDSWFNGYIVSIAKDHLVVLDRVSKKGEVVFFADISILEEFKGDYTTLVKVEEKKE